MGTLAEALRNASFQPVEAPADINQGVLSEFGKGLNSGLTGTGAGLRAVAGTVGEAMGFDEFAQDQYDAAHQAELRAQAEAPRVSSYKDVGSLRDAIHYGAGVVGGSAPSMALGLGAGMAARTAGKALVAGTLAQAPLEAGDVALKQLRDPEAQGMGAGERLLRQGVGGAASAALQTIVPAHVGGKLVGRGVDDAAKMTLKQAALRNAGAIPAEGLFEGGGEVVKQTAANNERDLDWESVKENVVGGMVGGVPMAGAGFVGDTTHGVPGKAIDAARGGFRSIRERLEAGKEKVVEKTPVRVKSALDDISEFVGGTAGKAKDTVSRVMRGETLADPAEFAGMDDAQISAKLTEDDQAKANTVKQWGEELVARASLAPETRAKVAEAIKNVTEPAAQAVIAKAKAAADKATEIKESVDRALRGVRTGSRAGEVVEGESRVVPDFDPAKALGQPDDYLDGSAAQVNAEEHRNAERDSLNDRINHWAQELKDPEVQAGMKVVDEREAYLKARIAQGLTAIQAMKEWKAMNGGKKLSEDTAGYQYQTAARMLSELGLKESHPEIFDDYETTLATLNLLGNLTAQMEKSPKVDGSLLMETVSIFGDNAADVVTRLYSKVGSADVKVQDNVYKAISEITAVTDHRQRLLDFITKQIVPEFQASTKITEMPDVLNELITIEMGSHGIESAAKQTLTNMQVVRAYTAAFGDKGMDVRNAVRKYVDSTRATVKYAIDSEGEKAIAEDNEVNEGRGGQVFDANGDRMEEAALGRTAMRYGGPLNRERKNTVMGRENGTALMRDEGEELVTHLRKKYPNEETHTIEFEPLHDGSQYGHVVVKEQAGADDFTEAEINKMRLDTKKYPKSPSRLDVTTADGKTFVLDASKIANYTRNKGQDSFEAPAGTTKLERLVDGFKRGVASLSDQFGAKIEPQNNLVIGYVGGKEVTWGQAKKVVADTAEERADGNKDKELATGKVDTHHLKSEGDSLKGTALGWRLDKSSGRSRTHREDPETGAQVRELGNPDFDEAGYLKRQGAERILKADERTEPSIDENIHLATALKGEAPGRGRSNMDGSGHWVDDRADKRTALVNLANELKARSGAGVKALGAKLEALAKNNALPNAVIDSLFNATDRNARGLTGPATAKTSDIAAIVAPIYDRYKDYKAPTKAEPTKAEPLLAKAIAQRAEYLRNPPADYSPEKARGIIDWAAKQLERVDAEKGGDADRQDQLSDYRSGLKQLIKDAKRITEADAELERKMGPQGSTPNPKAVAAKKAAFLEKAASGDEALISELRKSNDAKGLQRAAEALDALKPEQLTDGHLEVYDAINDRLAELVQDESVALGLQTKHYDLSGTSPSSDARAWEAEIKAYLDKVLGKSVKRVWASFTHAGEFERMKLHDVIRLSVHALNPLSTAYHESLHAFFAQLRDAGAHDVIDVLQKAAKQDHVMAQLQEIYKNQPAVLRQLDDPEERVAYMYQHWVADPKGFKVSIAARTTMEKIKAFIRGVLGIWSNDQRAVHIMEYFSSGEYAKNIGKPNATYRAMMEPGTNRFVEALKPLTEPLDRLAEATFASGDARLRDTGIKALIEIADRIKLGHTDASGLDRGFIPAARMESTKRLAALGDALAEYNQEDLSTALEHLQRETAPTDARIADLVTVVRDTLRDTRQYMLDSGLKVGDLGPNYFPRVWDVHYMTTHEEEVRAMLEKYVQSGQYKGNVSNLLRDLLGRDGTEYMGETATPGMQHAKRRKLGFITPEDAAPFLKKDLAETLVSYITQATRRAEWQRRFAENMSTKPGAYLSRMDYLKEQARKQGATDEDMRTLDLYLKGVDGTLGDTMDPGLRRLTGNLIVYQNIRLLPMAAFSMAVDPLGILVRGGSVKESYNAAVRGLKSIITTLKGEGKPDEIEQLAELMGVIDAASISHVMSDIYTQGMVGGKMRKLNDLFFKYNFVEGINRSMRIGATEAAMRFLAKHADGKASEHSKRWMAELGILQGDIKWLAAEKRIALTVEDGLTPAQEHRVQLAVNQWVDGAVLRPDATDKPIWMNDPHWALVSHLKQFVYTFQHVILGRVVHEFKHGNFTPAMALSMYVPTMILADTFKGLIQGGGETPEWKRGWGPADYIGHGIQRAGLFGVGQFGVDALTDLRQGGTGVGALVGPTIEQFGDAVQALGGRKQFGPVVLDALPANALYKNWFDSGAASSEPMFSA